MSYSPIYGITGFLVLTQLVFMYFIIKNARYVSRKAKEPHNEFLPPVLLTVPCKGIDIGFESNITSFFELAYPDYYLNFVVESQDDPAYSVLAAVCEKYKAKTNAKSVNILVAGVCNSGSQKNHNLLCSLSNCPPAVKVLAFADSDCRPRPMWLNDLVHPLHCENVGLSTGYRWIIPERINAATVLLSSMNAKVAQFLGKSSIFNQAWGGSMAVKRELFYSLAMDKIWQTAISDDLSLTYGVRRSGCRLRFAPACLVASFEYTDFINLFKFARRQFLITRKSLPLVWLSGFATNCYSVFGLWGTLLWALCGDFTHKFAFASLIATSAVFLICQMVRVHTRQRFAADVIKEYAADIKRTAAYDYITAPLGSIIMLMLILSSLCGSTIIWRGRKYKILDAVRAIELH